MRGDYGGARLCPPYANHLQTVRAFYCTALAARRSCSPSLRFDRAACTSNSIPAAWSACNRSRFLRRWSRRVADHDRKPLRRSLGQTHHHTMAHQPSRNAAKSVVEVGGVLRAIPTATLVHDRHSILRPVRDFGLLVDDLALLGTDPPRLQLRLEGGHFVRQHIKRRLCFIGRRAMELFPVFRNLLPQQICFPSKTPDGSA